MPCICYVEKKFRHSTLRVIQQANDIIAEYSAQGYKLTLRQLYYQFVARDLIPNTMREYKKLGNIVNDARLAGYIDWDAIEDRTRTFQTNAHWDSPAAIVDACASQYAVDKWDTQGRRVEVWIEKDALVGVIARICKRLDITYFSTRGYSSQSAVWGAAMRFKDYVNNGQAVTVLHLSDHDPSGVDMTRDLDDRINKVFGIPVDMHRIALTMDQVDEYNPPPNPTKTTDSRAEKYIAEYGNESWELDALEPQVLEALIRDKVEAIREDDKYTEREQDQQDGRDVLKALAAGLRPDDDPDDEEDEEDDEEGTYDG